MLALLAFLLRAAIPSGFMLDQRDHAFPGLVVCGGLALDHAAKSDPHKDKTPSHTPCLFAMSAVFNAPAPAPSIEAPVLALAFVPTDYRAVRPGLGLAAPPPWATGPPLSA